MLKCRYWMTVLASVYALCALTTAIAAARSSPTAAAPRSEDDEWPSYNRVMQSERFSRLAEINTSNVTQLHQICEYDTGSSTNFESGLTEAGGLLYGTTDTDTFALNPSTCREVWRVREEVTPSAIALLKVNRGAVIFKGKVFRGLLDGRLIAYDALHGKKLWTRRIGDPNTPQVITASPLAWEDLVFVSNAIGDIRGVRGAIYALSVSDGRVVWQQSLVPAQQGEPKATGWGNVANISGGASWTSYSLDPELGLLYVPVANPSPDYDVTLRPGANQFTNSVLILEARTGHIAGDIPIVPADFRDYDTSTAPALFTSRTGARLLAVAAKDGVLHVFDRLNLQKQFDVPVTKIENRNTPLGVGESVHYCPGDTGGVEWNGPAYDESLNRIYTGAIQWCVTITLAPSAVTAATPVGQPWTGQTTSPPGNPGSPFGIMDPISMRFGWLYSVDAETGQVIWNFKSDFPFLAGVTATGGGLLLAGDLGGTLYAFASDNGHLLWSKKLDRALGGGIITYKDEGLQRIAVAAGFTSTVFLTQTQTAKVLVFGVDRIKH
jgi:alcohol dehydrogenase (cytochrome c)